MNARHRLILWLSILWLLFVTQAAGCGARSSPGAPTGSDGPAFSSNPSDAGSARAPCQLGQAVELATSPGARAVALDETAAYWAVGDGIWRIPIAGGTPLQLVTGEQPPADITVDDTHVYWTSNAAGQARVSAVTKTGGSSRLLWSEEWNQARAIAVDGTRLYWIAEWSHNAKEHRTKILAVAKDGGVPAVIAADEADAVSLVVDEARLYWMNVGSDTEHYGGTVRAAPKAGGPAITLASQQLPLQLTHPDYSAQALMAVDSKFIYWLHPGEQVIRKAPKIGGPPLTLAFGLRNPYAIAVAGETLYCSEDNQVTRLALPTSSSSTVYCTGGRSGCGGQHRPFDLAVRRNVLITSNGAYRTQPGVLLAVCL